MFASLTAFARFATLAPLITLHSCLYGVVQRHVYRKESFMGLEEDVPRVKRGALKELVLTICVDAGILLHTYLVLRTGTTTGIWIDSQYALEIAVKLVESMKLLWNPSLHSAKELLGHHAISLMLLCASYATHHTAIGFTILSITNTTNLFFDYFKYGLLTEDPMLRWMSSLLFAVMFFFTRVYTLGVQLLYPLFTRFYPLSSIPSVQVLFYGTTLSGIYALQCYWFYRLILHTWRNTRRLFQRPKLEDQMKTDFMELIQHLTDAETTIQEHLRSHALDSNVALKDESVGDNLNSTDESAMTNSTIPVEIEPFDMQNLIQNVSQKLEEEDAIIEEALSQWRACIFKSLNHEKNKDV